MRLKQEVLDAMVDLEWQVTNMGGGCECGAPNAHPPCSYCTHPGHPLVLEVEESWEAPEHHAAYWAMRAKASAVLRAAGLAAVDGDEFEFIDRTRGFCVGLGWCETDNKPFWFASRSALYQGGDPKQHYWRQNFDAVEAALAFGVIESAVQPPEPTWLRSAEDRAATARAAFKNTFTG